MDINKISSSQIINQTNSLKDVKNPNNLTDTQKQEAAKKFESVLLEKMLDSMQKTVTDWDGDKSPASKQINSLFNTYLARDMADKGGLGLWKDICSFYGDRQKNQNQNSNNNSLDESV
jgi:Rod binding domain-containing protein